METHIEGKKNIKLKHSSLGIIAVIIFFSPIIPVTFMFMPYLFSKIGLYIRFHPNIALFFADVTTAWMLLAPLAGFIMSLIDLRQPNRRKILPKIILILVGVLFIAAIVFTYLDITRMINNLN